MNPRIKKNLIQSVFAMPFVLVFGLSACGTPPEEDNSVPYVQPSPNPAKSGWVDLDGVKFRCNGYTGIYKGTTSDGATVDIKIDDDDRNCYE